MKTNFPASNVRQYKKNMNRAINQERNNKRKTRKIITDHDKDNDCVYMNWGKVEFSVELFKGKLVLDIDKNDKIVGFEIFDFQKELHKNEKHKTK